MGFAPIKNVQTPHGLVRSLQEHLIPANSEGNIVAKFNKVLCILGELIQPMLATDTLIAFRSLGLWERAPQCCEALKQSTKDKLNLEASLNDGITNGNQCFQNGASSYKTLLILSNGIGHIYGGQNKLYN